MQNKKIPKKFHFYTSGVSKGHGFYITSSGEIFGFGQNFFHQLGIHNDDVSSVQLIKGDYCSSAPIKTMTSFRGRIKDIILGYQSTIILTNNNQLYGCGLNVRNELCLGDHINRSTPTHVTYFKNREIESISMGFYHVIITVKGDNENIYANGRNGYGQLGCNKWNLEEDVKVEKVNIKRNIVIDIKCGGYFTLFLTNERKVLMCGEIFNEGRINTPTLIEGFDDFSDEIQSLSVGFYHFIMIGNEGIYGMGDNDESQITSKSNTIKMTWIYEMDDFRNDIIDIKAGYKQTLYHLKNGSVLGMGNINQLGAQKHIDDLKIKGWDCVKKYRLNHIEQIHCFESCVFLIDQLGNVHCGGYNRNNILNFGYHQWSSLGLSYQNQNVNMVIHDHMRRIKSINGYNTIFLSISLNYYDIIVKMY